MKKTILFIAILLISGTVIAQTTPVPSKVVVFSKFPTEVNVSFTKVFKPKESAGFRLFLTDSTLFIVDPMASTGYFFNQYLLKDNTLVGQYIKRGRGNGQATGLISSGIYKNKLWAHDITQNKIIMIDLKKPVIGLLPTVQEYKTNKFYYTVAPIDSNRFFAAGAESTLYKMQELDLRSGNEVDKYVTFDVPKDMPLNSWNMAYNGFLFAAPAGDKVALAYRITDQVEIFNRDTKSSKLIKGPENFNAEFNPFTSNGMDVMERIDKTRFAFIGGGAATEKYIYLLYSGEQHETVYKNSAKYVYIYDWDGNPVKKLNLSTQVSAIVVSADNQTLYAFDVDSGSIVKAAIGL